MALVVVALALLCPSDAAAQPDEISVSVSGVRNTHGQVGCMLFASADGFPKRPDRAVGRRFVPISGTSAQCRFEGVAPGTYAAIAMHDENSNGKLDRNFLGIPSEGWGASRDARGGLGPPSFDDAAFRFAGGHATVAIAIHY